MAQAFPKTEGAVEAAPSSHRGFSLSNRTREWIAGYLFVLPDALGLLDIRRRPDAAVAEPRLLFGQRIWRIFLCRARQLSPNARRSAVLAQLARNDALYRPAGARPLCDGPGPGLAGPAQYPLQRLRAHDAVRPADRQSGRRRPGLAGAAGRQDRSAQSIHLVASPRSVFMAGRPPLCALCRRLHQRLVPDGLLHADISRRSAGHSARNITKPRESTAQTPSSPSSKSRCRYCVPPAFSSCSSRP